jgi:hypothetical protein
VFKHIANGDFPRGAAAGSPFARRETPAETETAAAAAAADFNTRRRDTCLPE